VIPPKKCCLGMNIMYGWCLELKIAPLLGDWTSLFWDGDSKIKKHSGFLQLPICAVPFDALAC
jgi:hypothetical protein